jgi:hypothetical protein
MRFVRCLTGPLMNSKPPFGVAMVFSSSGENMVNKIPPHGRDKDFVKEWLELKKALREVQTFWQAAGPCIFKEHIRLAHAAQPHIPKLVTCETLFGWYSSSDSAPLRSETV